MSWSSARSTSSSSGWASSKPSTPSSATSSPSTAPKSSAAPSASPQASLAPRAGWTSAAPPAQASVSPEELQDADATTQRILRKLEHTHDVADTTLGELERQHEAVVRTQDDLADIHDDLDTSERKLAGIKSFWGIAWGKKKHDARHAKARDKYERELAKEALKGEEVRVKETRKADKERSAQQMGELEQSLKDPALGKDLRAVEREHKKAMKRGEDVTQGSGDLVVGHFVFEERHEGTGAMVQAEEDLEAIEEHVKALKGKAWLMGQRVDDTTRRLEDVQQESDRADQRTQKNIQRGNKIIG